MIDPRELPHPMTVDAARSLLVAACLCGAHGIYVFTEHGKPNLFLCSRVDPAYKRGLPDMVRQIERKGYRTFLNANEISVEERIALRRDNPSTLASFSPFL